ncbi:hypothetical protein MKJ04_03795 [Pontibacter sp. E15-1]|uniref:hypothetical protein n=1 Tax=Pontibacter sp. E15-1 TaxID=2919918 RepID=UPI001F4FFFD4|nr:hypothetical protein [Pontibacter sp. E15-1]MCJ8163951.1 hypothetical protein [Pontibacter sp. E15-1]
MRFYKLLLGSVLLANSLAALAQTNNDALLLKTALEAEDAGKLKFGLYSFGFFRNNEYFNKIADGYTLFGYQLNPKLIYYPAASVRLEAGVFLWKDFGSSGYQDIAPTFTVKLQRDTWALLFGTLEGSLNHGYIEPLYDFERVITNRLENGLQYKLHTHTVVLDTWVDWNNMLYRGEDDQERINGGAALRLQLMERPGRKNAADSLRLTLPLQFTAQHKGGQIDASDLPLTTLANTAIGIELEKVYARKVLHRLYTQNYLVGFRDFSNDYQLPYRKGHGIYLNAGADTKHLNMMLSYWQGKGYLAELGGKLYQSASTTYKYPDYLQEERRLLLLRLMKDIEIIDHLNLTMRLEPVMDLDNPKLEFSSGFYLTLDTEFFVAKPKK